MTVELFQAIYVEYLKAYDDYLKTGTGWMRGGKHVPMHEVCYPPFAALVDPRERRTPTQHAVQELLS